MLPADDGDPHHIQGDVEQVLDQEWDIAVLHPPCTRLANSGVRWLAERNLWDELQEGARLFNVCLKARARIGTCVENPIQHKHARALIDRPHTQIIQPWQFGHGETKATCLWLRGLPMLKPMNVVDGREARIHRLPATADRWKLRSATYQGIADAMAWQWGQL